jgi:alkanesulfonate monooxygenase SsuD/methylene tetrahydromethanopterin reductase-like flavin-dependent oxidoreductase (luciferase family)
MVGMSQIPRVGILFRPQLPPERLAGFVAAAEDAGLDDLWLWEDCFLEGGLTTATAALAWSSSVRVGLGLMPVPLRNPALAAMEIATVARLFPGRLVAGVGHGVLDWMTQVGANVSSPMTLLREYTVALYGPLLGSVRPSTK